MRLLSPRLAAPLSPLRAALQETRHHLFDSPQLRLFASVEPHQAARVARRQAFLRGRFLAALSLSALLIIAQALLGGKGDSLWIASFCIILALLLLVAGSAICPLDLFCKASFKQARMGLHKGYNELAREQAVLAERDELLASTPPCSPLTLGSRRL